MGYECFGKCSTSVLLHCVIQCLMLKRRTVRCIPAQRTYSHLFATRFTWQSRRPCPASVQTYVSLQVANGQIFAPSVLWVVALQCREVGTPARWRHLPRKLEEPYKPPRHAHPPLLAIQSRSEEVRKHEGSHRCLPSMYSCAQVCCVDCGLLCFAVDKHHVDRFRQGSAWRPTDATCQ